MKINVVNTGGHPLPAYAKPGDAGMDLRSAERTLLRPGSRARISTGVRVAIPDGYVGLIWPRSGLANDYGIDVLGGVIDASYRGEIGVVLVNHGGMTLFIDPGDRIAQLLIQPVVRAELVQVESLDATERGDGGFGHSGRE